MSTHVIGSEVVLRGRFRKWDGVTQTRVLADPTTTSCIVTKPDNTVTTYVFGVDSNLVKISTGIYECSVDADQINNGAINWKYRFVGTGAAKGVQKGNFDVIPNT